jgi:hypothetical protein
MDFTPKDLFSANPQPASSGVAPQGMGTLNKGFVGNLLEIMQYANQILEQLNNLKNNPMVADVLQKQGIIKPTMQGGRMVMPNSPIPTTIPQPTQPAVIEKTVMPEEIREKLRRLLTPDNVYNLILKTVTEVRNTTSPKMTLGELEEWVVNSKDILIKQIGEQLKKLSF